MRRLALCLLLVCAARFPAAGHVLDQYLQLAQIDLLPGGARIDMRLTPGVLVADCIFALIDLDRDGQISAAEEQIYARRVLEDIVFSVNGIKTPLTLNAQRFPGRDEMRAGMGSIRLTFAASVKLASGDQQTYFRNNHLPELGAYLVNALAPSTNEIRIGSQQRDLFQREMRLSFRVDSPDSRPLRVWAGALTLCLFLALILWKWRKSLAGVESGAAGRSS